MFVLYLVNTSKQLLITGIKQIPCMYDNASSGSVLLGGGTERWRLGWVRLSVAVVLGGGRGLSGGNRGVWGRERGGGAKEEFLRRRVGGMVSVPGEGGLRARF